MTHEATNHACCASPGKTVAPMACPACGIAGRAVKRATLQALLKPGLCPGDPAATYRFCANPACELVYFCEKGSRSFARADLTVRVGVKEASAPHPLCYCFGHSAESIQQEWARTGKSTVEASIRAQVQAGTCHCVVTNPGGACCLGEIAKAVRALTHPAATKPGDQP